MTLSKNRYKKHRRSFFIVTCLLALAFHAWAIFLLSEIGIDISSIGSITPYSKKLGETRLNHWEKKKKEALIRNKELTQAFQTIRNQPVMLDDIEIDFEALTEVSTHEISLQQFKELSSVNISKELKNSIEEGNKKELFKQSVIGNLENLLNSISSEQRPSLDSLTLVFNGDEEVSEGIVQATSRMLGNILKEERKETKKNGSLSVGFIEKASLEGTAIHNRSGIIAPSDIEHDSSASFGSSYRNNPAFTENDLLKDLSQTLSSHTKVGKGSLVLQSLNLDKEDSIEELLSLSEMGSIASSEDFFVDVKYAKSSTKKGYLFKVAIYPKKHIVFKRIKQNMFFLIDRSHSINKKRYRYTKEAVLDALKLMHPGDTFNIFVFDQNLVSLATENLAWNHKNLVKAREFLSGQKHGGLFASTELYSSLDTIVPTAVAETEVNTAILLSDGDTFIKRDKQRQMIAQWTLQNRGKVSLFSVASGAGNNIPLLEVITAFNKGFLIYSQQDTDTKKSLTQLIQAIRNPIGKDITVTPITKNPTQKVELFPSDSRLPDLYENLPYTLIGHTSEKKEFYIFLQGRYYGRWLDIKQKVTFTKDESNLEELESDFLIQEAFNLYENYLHDGDYQYVQLAKEKLRPLGIRAAFE
jgi:hypothetical protein